MGSALLNIRDFMHSLWPMEESAGSTRVDHFGLNDLADVNTVGQATGKIGNAADFTEPDLLQKTSPSGLSFDGTGDFAFAAWVRWDTLTDPFHTIVSKGNATGNNREYRLRPNTGTVQVFWEVDTDGSAGFDTQLLSTDTISAGTLHFLFWGYDATAEELFLSIDDGTVKTLSHTAAINTSSDPFKVGNHDFAGSDGLDGLVDELVVFTGGIPTAAEVTAMHNSGSGVDLTDNFFAFSLTADADFAADAKVERGMDFSLTADADFAAGLRVPGTFMSNLVADANFTIAAAVERPLAATLTADANFTMALDGGRGLAFSLTADADFEADLATADHDGFVDGLLGLTDQMGETADRLQVPGISSNLASPAQWQAEVLTDLDPIAFYDLGDVSSPGIAAPAATIHHAIELAEKLANDWFDKLFVLPPSVEAGFVVSDQSIPFEIYSSFLTATRSLDTFVNNVGVGISLGGFPGLPESILPQTGFVFTLEIAQNGPPTFDGTLDFGFDVQTILVPVTGQRVRLFAVEPDRRVNERLVFKTNVFRRLDESEQRRSNRKTPRQMFEYTYDLVGLDRQAFDSLTFDRQGQFFAVPVWFEPTFLTQDVALGDSVLNVVDTSFGDFRVGGLVAIFEDVRTAEVLEIGAVTATTISLTTLTTAAHTRVASRILPVRVATMGPMTRGEKFQRGFQRSKVTWRVRDNDSDLSSTTAFGTFNGKVFLDEANVIENRLRESMERRMTIIDGTTGVFEVIPEALVSRRVHPKTFLATTRQRMFEVRQFLHALKGRRTSFYIPTFYDEFTVTQDVNALDDTITFDNFGYTLFVGGRAPRDAIQLVLKDGTKLPRNVIGQTELSLTEERIQVDATWGVSATVSEIDRVEYITKVRMNSDEVRIQHDNARGQATITVPLIEVLE